MSSLNQINLKNLSTITVKESTIKPKKKEKKETVLLRACTDLTFCELAEEKEQKILGLTDP